VIVPGIDTYSSAVHVRELMPVSNCFLLHAVELYYITWITNTCLSL